VVKLHHPHQDTGSLLSHPLGVSARILIARSALVPQGQSQDLHSSLFVPWLFLHCVEEIYWALMFFLALTEHQVISAKACQNQSCFNHLLHHPPVAPRSAPGKRLLRSPCIQSPSLGANSHHIFWGKCLCVLKAHSLFLEYSFIFVPGETWHMVNALYLLIETKHLSYFFKKEECILYHGLFSHRTTYIKNSILLYFLFFNNSLYT